MAGVRGDIALHINLTQIGATGLGTPKLAVAIEEVLTLAPGTAAINQANCFYQSLGRSVAASSSEDLDLAGVLVDAFGATITAAEIVAIYIKAHSTNVNNAVVGAATAPFAGPLGAAGTYSILPGEWYLAVSEKGWVVGAGTTDDLKIANSGSGSAVVYDILIVGRTVAA